jgi:hypothetical protein
MCADDDFMIPAAIQKCLSFLDQNKAYASCQGHYTGFKNTNGGFTFYPMYTRIKEGNLASDSAEVRLNEYMAHYHQHFYTLHRTANLQWVFENSSEGIENGNFFELMVGSVPVINGKHQFLPVMFGIRESIPGSGGAVTTGFDIIARDSAHKSQYKRFVENLATCLARVSEMDLNSAKEKVDSAVEKYVQSHQSTGAKKKEQSLTTKVKNRIKLFIRDQLYSRLYSLVYGIDANFAAISTLRLEGFPLNNEGDRKELKKVLILLKKHNVKPNLA